MQRKSVMRRQFNRKISLENFKYIFIKLSKTDAQMSTTNTRIIEFPHLEMGIFGYLL